MDDLPYADEGLPGSCTPKMVDESQGVDEAEARREAWYDYQDDEDFPESEDD